MRKKAGQTSFQTTYENVQDWEKALLNNQNTPNHVLVVDVHATWCGKCVSIMSTLEKINMDMADEHPIAFGALDSEKLLAELKEMNKPVVGKGVAARKTAHHEETEEEHKKHLHKEDVTRPSYTALLESFVGLSEPHFLIFKEGELIRKMRGVNTPALQKLILQLLSNEAIEKDGVEQKKEVKSEEKKEEVHVEQQTEEKKVNEEHNTEEKKEEIHVEASHEEKKEEVHVEHQSETTHEEKKDEAHVVVNDEHKEHATNASETEHKSEESHEKVQDHENAPPRPVENVVHVEEKPAEVAHTVVEEKKEEVKSEEKKEEVHVEHKTEEKKEEVHVEASHEEKKDESHSVEHKSEEHKTSETVHEEKKEESHVVEHTETTTTTEVM